MLRDSSQGNYLIKRQHNFAYVSALCRLHKHSFFGQFGKLMTCAYMAPSRKADDPRRPPIFCVMRVCPYSGYSRNLADPIRAMVL